MAWADQSRRSRASPCPIGTPQGNLLRQQFVELDTPPGRMCVPLQSRWLGFWRWLVQETHRLVKCREIMGIPPGGVNQLGQVGTFQR